jgi:hypothetical protein
VVLGQPEPPITQSLGVLRGLEGAPQRVGRRSAFWNEREIEDR